MGVDSVSGLLNIKAADIEQTPAFGAKVDTDYILGMAKMNEGAKILLDIDKVQIAEEITQLTPDMIWGTASADA